MFKNMGDLVKQAQQMQEKMQAMREEMRQRQVEGVAGGGLVRVTLNGCSEAVSVKIDPQIGNDREMLEDLLLAALRDAHQKVQEMVQKEMGGLAGPLAGVLGLPGT